MRLTKDPSVVDQSKEIWVIEFDWKELIEIEIDSQSRELLRHAEMNIGYALIALGWIANQVEILQKNKEYEQKMYEQKMIRGR
jgi:hypothetical protein